MYQEGEIVTWRGINRDYKGEIVGFYGPFAVARIEGSARYVLLHNGILPKRKNLYDGRNIL